MTLHIGFVIFDNLTQLDFTGPLQVLNRIPNAHIHIAAKSLAPVMSDCGLGLVPTTSFADCPYLDALCIPGGFGVSEAIADETLVKFVKHQGVQATYVTSVCTGAFILGAAGLLKGKKTTTHWAFHHWLALTEAIPTQGRVVRDGNLFTGGGVTAGIDFALTLMAEIAGEEMAKRAQLALEYDPAPPFDSGSPLRANAPLHKELATFYKTRAHDFADRVVIAMNKLE